ncbi:hypothetical protein [Jongsikchunia kroppenstedtii]|uniref:hypothetical protein n=1 Tax=Jongsikchunia kroppenstedtii TaxID=1121721 RepID=UPI003F852BD0
MKTVAAKRIVASAVTLVAIAASAGLLADAGAAGAVTINQNARYVAVWLSHEETVQAAQMGLGAFLEQPGIRQHTQLTLRDDSMYAKTIHTVNGHIIINVTIAQMVNEAAARPGGQIGLYYDRAAPTYPLGVNEYWPTPTHK